MILVFFRACPDIIGSLMSNRVRDLSFEFAVGIVIFSRCLIKRDRNVLHISMHLLKSGTSIGANVEEALAAQSQKDFLTKIYIGFKEARECNYWLRLIKTTLVYDHRQIKNLLTQSEELILILSSITKTTRTSLK